MKRMAYNSDDVSSYSSKMQKMMLQMIRLEEKLEKLGGSLESMKIGMTSVNTKVETLSRVRYEEDPTRAPLDALKCKIPPFVVDQVLECFGYDDYVKVRMVTYEFSKFVLAIYARAFKCLEKGHIASQCPNKRNMDLRKDGTIDNESSQEESSSINECESSSDYSPNEGDLFMVRRLMNA
ncbi:hypothetical protein CR513_62532, partial [Mucuna pruriens]